MNDAIGEHGEGGAQGPAAPATTFDIIDAIGDSIVRELAGKPLNQRGKTKELLLAPLRGLEKADLPRLNHSGVSQPVPMVQQLRDSHHFIARLLAEGRRPFEVSGITGYSSGRIGVLLADPAFQELVEYYRDQTEALYLNVHERLAALGATATAVLQERLDDHPESFTNKELMELLGETFDRSVAPPKAGTKTGNAQNGGGGTTVIVSFAAQPQPQGQIVDVTPRPAEGPATAGRVL